MNLIWISICIGLLFFTGFVLAVYAIARRANALERLTADAAGSNKRSWQDYFGRAEVALKSLGQAIPRAPEK